MAEQPHDPVADPGWRPAVPKMPLAIVPGAAMAVMRSSTDKPPIIALRALFLGFAASLVVYLALLLFIFTPVEERASGASPAALLLLGLALLWPGAVLWQRRQPLPCRDGEQLAQAFTSLFFRGVAFANAPALFGLISAFMVGEIWPYAVGMAVAAASNLLVAPTRAQIARHDASLAADGCSSSLSQVMFAPPDRKPPPPLPM